MQFSNADLFFDQVLASATSNGLYNGYNRNWEDKAYLVVKANTTKSVQVVLYTGPTEAGATTAVRSWAATPNKDGYVVCERLPRGLGKWMKLGVVIDSSAHVTAGITLEQDMDYDWNDRDPKAVFNGTKTEADIRTEIA
jgi:hypothetical protein